MICFTNGQGEVVAVDSATRSVAFTVAIPTLQLTAFSINDNSDVAGWCSDVSSFFYRGGVVTNFPDQIYQLNNSGQACGSTLAGPLPAIWDMTGPVPVVSKLVPPLPGCDSGYAEGINDAGCVVGNCYDSNDSSNVSHPFIYNGSKTIDLNTQVVGWTLDWVTGINNSGQIVASGWNEASSGSFLLTPTPFNMPNINAVLWAMLLGSGPASDGGGWTLVGGRVPDWVGPWGPTILSPAAQDAVLGIAMDAVAQRLGDRVGAEAIRTPALQMTARAVNRLMAPTLSPALRSASAPRPGAGPARRRGRFPFPPCPHGEPPKA